MPHIKYKYVGRIHFHMISHPEKIVLSMIIRIVASLVLVEPLYNA